MRFSTYIINALHHILVPKLFPVMHRFIHAASDGSLLIYAFISDFPLHTTAFVTLLSKK